MGLNGSRSCRWRASHFAEGPAPLPALVRVEAVLDHRIDLQLRLKLEQMVLFESNGRTVSARRPTYEAFHTFQNSEGILKYFVISRLPRAEARQLDDLAARVDGVARLERLNDVPVRREQKRQSTRRLAQSQRRITVSRATRSALPCGQPRFRVVIERSHELVPRELHSLPVAADDTRCGELARLGGAQGRHHIGKLERYLCFSPSETACRTPRGGPARSTCAT